MRDRPPDSWLVEALGQKETWRDLFGLCLLIPAVLLALVVGLGLLAGWALELLDDGP